MDEEAFFDAGGCGGVGTEGTGREDVGAVGGEGEGSKGLGSAGEDEVAVGVLLFVMDVEQVVGGVAECLHGEGFAVGGDGADGAGGEGDVVEVEVVGGRG